MQSLVSLLVLFFVFGIKELKAISKSLNESSSVLIEMESLPTNDSGSIVGLNSVAYITKSVCTCLIMTFLVVN